MRTTPTTSPQRPVGAVRGGGPLPLGGAAGGLHDRPTGKVRRLLQEYNVRCPVFVAPTGIDLRHFRQGGDPMRRAVLRASLGIPADGTVLVSVGRLAEEKNLQELLRLRASLGHCPVTLLLVGDGPYRPQLEQLAGELGLASPEVIFAGMVPPEEVPTGTGWGICSSAPPPVRRRA